MPPILIRNDAPVKLAGWHQLVSNAGEGALCMNCHQSRQNASKYVDSNPGSAHYGPHEGPQADMLEGANGYTYGQNIPSSAHAFVAKDTCVACHMQAVATTDAAFLQGRRTYLQTRLHSAAGSSTPVDLVECVPGLPWNGDQELRLPALRLQWRRQDRRCANRGAEDARPVELDAPGWERQTADGAQHRRHLDTAAIEGCLQLAIRQ